MRFISHSLKSTLGLAAFVLGALGSAPAVATGIFSNTTAIDMSAGGAAPPYPSTIAAAGLLGTVTKVTVTLHNLTHTDTHDIIALLVGTDGDQVKRNSGHP